MCDNFARPFGTAYERRARVGYPRNKSPTTPLAEERHLYRFMFFSTARVLDLLLILLSYRIMFACCSCSDFVGVSVSFVFLVLFVLGAQVPTTTDADRPTDAARPSQVGGDSVCGVTAESNDSAE